MCEAHEQLQAHHSVREKGDPEDVPAVPRQKKRALLGYSPVLSMSRSLRNEDKPERASCCGGTPGLYRRRGLR